MSNSLIREVITGRMGFYDMKLPELAKRSGMKYSLLYRRMKNPMDFTLRELENLNKVLHFSKQDKEKIYE